MGMLSPNLKLRWFSVGAPADNRYWTKWAGIMTLCLTKISAGRARNREFLPVEVGGVLPPNPGERHVTDSGSNHSIFSAQRQQALSSLHRHIRNPGEGQLLWRVHRLRLIPTTSRGW